LTGPIASLHLAPGAISRLTATRSVSRWAGRLGRPTGRAQQTPVAIRTQWGRIAAENLLASSGHGPYAELSYKTAGCMTPAKSTVSAPPNATTHSSTGSATVVGTPR